VVDAIIHVDAIFHSDKLELLRLLVLEDNGECHCVQDKMFTNSMLLMHQP
jgi:hypothetical protein